MYQITAVKPVPDECEGYRGQRITLRSDNLKLTVPNIKEDGFIRYQLERKFSLVDAYTNAGARYIIPAAPLRSCIELVFKTPYFDPMSGEWKTAPGKFTCIGFHKCFQEYVRAQAAFPEEDPAGRRLKIAPGAYAPSYTEEACIKNKFLMQIPLDKAYKECGAGGITPRWPGALQFIETAFLTSISSGKPFQVSRRLL